jgi:tetratricopeptide (TPR) repeat protein
LNNVAELYKSQGKYVEVEQLYKRALAIYEEQLGTEHPDTYIVRSNYAALLREMGQTQEARVMEATNGKQSGNEGKENGRDAPTDKQ